MTEKIRGVLEIDHERGVVYFHASHPKVVERYGVQTILRICRLPHPMPQNEQIDLTWDSVISKGSGIQPIPTIPIKADDEPMML